MQQWLVITGGGAQARAVELVDPVISIGSEGTIQLPDPAIAKQVLTLRKDATGAYIAEPGEGWVTRNNARFTKPARIGANDTFRIGSFRLVVQYRRAPQATKPAPTEAPTLDALITDARARMAWGEDPADVKRRLVAGGLSEEDAEDVVRRMDRAERTQTRLRGVPQIVIGGIGCGICVLTLINSNYGVGRMLSFLAVSLAVLLHGIYRLVFGDRERYEIG